MRVRAAAAITLVGGVAGAGRRPLCAFLLQPAGEERRAAASSGSRQRSHAAAGSLLLLPPAAGKQARGGEQLVGRGAVALDCTRHAGSRGRRGAGACGKQEI